jgi:hypothetical protein
MPLPKPVLDNRRFDQLVSESIGVLRRAAPEWTDQNASDPGITLLELFAWLGEQNIYRFDRLSDAAKRAFLRLLGVEQLAAGVATTVVNLESASAIALPPRIQLATANALLFETTEAVFVSPAHLARVEVAGRVLADETARNRAHIAFPAFGLQPRTGAALLLGFDRALNDAGARLSLHVWTDHWQDDAATRAALIDEERDSRAGTFEWPRHYRVRTIWEYWSANGWHPLSDVVDETRALTLSGFVRFSAAPDHQPSGPNALFYVRCRMTSGRFECPPDLLHVALNAVSCEHALTRMPREIGISRGHAGAVFALGEAPVVAGSSALQLENSAGDVQSDWREAVDWDRAGPHDRVFRLDPGRGEIQSGDGLRGEILPAGFRLIASYRCGGGHDGNIGTGTLIDVPASGENLDRAPALRTHGAPVAVLQPFAARGGSERESIESAQARAFDAASAVDKGVTLDDIERIALATPGVPIARAGAVANIDPLLPCFPAVGAVMVIVVPQCHAAAPMPSQAMLDAVARFIEPRRLVTSEILVVAPRYRRIGVQATLHIACGASARQVEQIALARIAARLDPLTGGPDGTGWPFGRAVYRSEMMALLAAVEGVERITSLAFTIGAGGAPICENAVLCPNELVRAGRHRLRIESEIATNLKRSEPHECESA